MEMEMEGHMEEVIVGEVAMAVVVVALGVREVVVAEGAVMAAVMAAGQAAMAAGHPMEHACSMVS